MFCKRDLSPKDTSRPPHREPRCRKTPHELVASFVRSLQPLLESHRTYELTLRSGGGGGADANITLKLSQKENEEEGEEEVSGRDYLCSPLTSKLQE